MAIRRCPYCKAIIDESDKYCNNCGTQLLFPEDEYIEEDIPGEKIIEEEEEEQEEELKEELEEEEAEEEVLEEERAEEEFFEEPEEEGLELKEEEEEEEHEEEAEEELFEERREEDIEKKYEVALEDDELIFKTKELKELTPQAEEEEEGFKEEEREGEGLDEGEGLEAREGAELEGGEGGKAQEKFPKTSEVLPPWAREMKGGQLLAFAEEEEEEEREKAEEEEKTGAEPTVAPTPSPGWTQDSGMGVPESVTQSTLLFGDTGAIARETAGELERKEAATTRGEKEKGMKSKLVDLIFITAIWLISLWFAAQVTHVSFFRMLTKSPLPVLGFYFILLLLYFFLFLFFLGETLGDHYFSGED